MNFMRLKKYATLGLLLVIFTAVVQAADQVSINVTGKVIASPCQIKGDSLNKTVDLGKSIMSGNLHNAGSSTTWVNFSLNLINCPRGTTQATMTMHGPSDINNPADMYVNSGTATNIAVQLQTQQGDPLGDGKFITGNVLNNALSYNLRARAYSHNGNVEPGTIEAVVTATFVYQ